MNGIVGNSIMMQSTYNFKKEQTVQESLRFWLGSPNSGREEGGLQRAIADQLNISEAAKQLYEEKQTMKNDLVAQAQNDTESGLSDGDNQKILLLEKFIEQLTGKKIKLDIATNLKFTDNGEMEIDLNGDKLNVPTDEPEWGMQYTYHETYAESEEMSFRAKGEIKTADGETIKFSVKLDMKRAYYAEKNFSLQIGHEKKKVDPLAINLNEQFAGLTDAKFKFDLDADGKVDEVSFTNQGSGFLALDKNGDGKVTDGSELFGPSTGDGFIELGAYDEDKSGWIDKNDAIFDQLRFWTKDAEGNDKLLALGQVGVGAIYLGHIDTPFEVKNENNDLNGQIKSTGLYLTDNKTVGTVQQVDLTV